ncbi:C4-dicarboxylate TRAP transporter substrate-binding protein [Pseudooceanicola sp.]|uniref:C4-dicarboxylate TRAP transporter substrate-binding protein n=1 Tax=Pseudooceanicola sp. TaxID=1914328 RepID=UPI00262F1969|nr:C4-dicarboxylate TRAP transporter substrate-binding protein [Pseudooceanicola sp.]MDF1856816.1 C4-dicarboxylate TRAP transporter substrate-binding protein [Pseudooceanicola sp.]
MNGVSKLCAALAAVATLGFAGAASAETYLRYNESGPNRGSRADAVQFFADRVGELSNGEIKVDIIWGGALLGFKATADGVKNGVADLGTVLAAYAPNQMKALSIGDLPINESSDAWVGMRAMYDLMTTNQQLKDSLAKQNSVYVTNFHSTAVQIDCREGIEINTLADLAGLKMRASGIYAKILADLGVNLISLSYDEVYQAYDSGLIDCEAGYFYTIKAYKLYEVIGKVYRIDFGQIAGFAVIANQDRWNSLTEAERDIIRQAAVEMIDHFAEVQITDIDNVVASLKAGNKVQVIDMQQAFRDELFSAGKTYIEAWKEESAADGLDADGIVDSYTALLDKYTQIRDTQGYPWAR